jgi:hypothetical protein
MFLVWIYYEHSVNISIEFMKFRNLTKYQKELSIYEIMNQNNTISCKNIFISAIEYVMIIR